MAIILLIKMEDGEVTELPLLSKISMGRSSSSDYTIKDNKMSGIHCTFEITSRDEVLFTDLGSTNGSYCNNSIVTKTLFRINDSILIGNTIVRIEERRLTIEERRSIGTSNNKQVEEKTFLHSNKTIIKSTIKKQKEMSEDANEIIKNSTVENEGGIEQKNVTKKRIGILDKNIKSRIKSTMTFSHADTMHDQEPSTGKTKLLKLDKNTVKKKKV